MKNTTDYYFYVIERNILKNLMKCKNSRQEWLFGCIYLESNENDYHNLSRWNMHVKYIAFYQISTISCTV